MTAVARASWLSFLAAFAVVCALGNPEPLRPVPRLLLLVVFDQLRGDYLERWSDLFGSDGFRRLDREGAWFTNCHYPYAVTVTGAGHATLGTGCTPAQHGIVENDWFDRSEGKLVYCATRGDRHGLVTGSESARSTRKSGATPERLLVRTIGELLKEETANRGKVIGLSLKDRGAVLPAGPKADLCLWFDDSIGSFVTSTYYCDKLPDYMLRFNASRKSEQWFGRDWIRFRSDVDYERASGPDDVTGEGTGIKQGRAFPHPMNGGEKAVGGRYYNAVSVSPFGNELLWMAAREILEQEELGRRKTTDLLVLSFSSNDLVGHAWGPDSQEVLDITLRSDVLVGEIVAYLDRKIGRENYLMVLSSDHGVCPLPEVMRARGKNAGRVEPTKAVAELNAHLQSRLGNGVQWVLARSGGGLYLNRSAMDERQIGQEAAENEVAMWLRQQPYTQAVYTRTQLKDGKGLDPIGEMVKAGFHPDRSPDVLPVFKPYWFTSRYQTGTTHGTPHPYDTHVPLIVFGGKAKPGRHAERVSPQLAAAVFSHVLGRKLEQCPVTIPAGLFE